jgi:hypothetical protein
VVFSSFGHSTRILFDVQPCCALLQAEWTGIQVPIPRIRTFMASGGHAIAPCDPGLASSSVKDDINMFPVTISSVVDTFEGHLPLPHDPPPRIDPQLKGNRRFAHSSSNVDAPSRQHRSKDNSNASVDTHIDHSKSSLKDAVRSDLHKGDVVINNRASCPDIRNLAAVPQLASPRWKKRRHRGRHRRHHSDNIMITASPPEDLRLHLPASRIAANGSNTHPTDIPSASSLDCSDSDDLFKSAPCDTWNFMDMVNDSVSTDLESSNTENAPQTSFGTLDSPPFTVCSSTSPDPASSKGQRRSTSRSWYSQALPFFSISLGGDDDVTEVLYFFKLRY